MKTKDPNDPRCAMRDLEWDNYYDSETRILHANWDEGFFSNTTTALWALADLANEGISPKQIQCTRGWDKYCDRSVHGDLDLYPIFFQPNPDVTVDASQVTSGRVWPSYNHRRYALTNLGAWTPFVSKWFEPSNRVMEKVEKYSKKCLFDPKKTIGVFYRGTDKKFEIPISDFREYRQVLKFLLNKNPECRIFVQTDQEEFRDYLIGEFGSRCFYLEEMPVAKGSTGLHFLKDEELQIDRVEYGVRVLAATYLMSRCKALINCTGNMAWWAALYRGNTRRMYQFDEHANLADPKGRDFTANPMISVARAIRDSLGF